MESPKIVAILEKAKQRTGDVRQAISSQIDFLNKLTPEVSPSLWALLATSLVIAIAGTFLLTSSNPIEQPKLNFDPRSSTQLEMISAPLTSNIEHRLIPSDEVGSPIDIRITGLGLES